MSTPPTTQWPTKFVVSCLDEDDPNHRHLSLRVEWRGPGQWMVGDGFGCLDIDGNWSHEPLPSEREAEWKARHRFDLETALRIAHEIAPTLEINGITVRDALARRDAADREASDRLRCSPKDATA
jgi:hypothetical protein